MPSKYPNARFQEIIIEIDFVDRATSGMSFDQFKADDTIRRAVERSYAIISEAAARIGPEAETLAPDIPWIDIKRFGNVIRHEYGNIDYVTLWEIRDNDLEPLRAACVKALERPDAAT